MYETEFTDAVVKDTRFTADVPDSGDMIYVQAELKDDGKYHGSYSYRNHVDRGKPGSGFGPGTVMLSRTNHPDGGNTFQGHWTEGIRQDVWIFEIDPPV